MASEWNTSIPVFVTRQTAGSGTTGYFSLPAWWVYLSGLLIGINVLVWSVIGLITAVGVLT